MKMEVYLIGDQNSPKNNQWLMMTNGKEEVPGLMALVGPEATTKTITVGPAPKRRPKK